MSFFEKNGRPEIRFKIKKGEEFDPLHRFPLFSRAIVTFPALRHGRFSLFPIEPPRSPADALKDRDGRFPSERAILKSHPETPMLHKRKERIKMNENVKNLLKEQLWTLGTCSDEPNAVPVAFKDVLARRTSSGRQCIFGHDPEKHRSKRKDCRFGL